MLGTSSPPDRVIGVELDAGTTLFLVDDLKTVVVDEHVCRTTLELVRRDGLLDRLDRGSDDRVQTLFVHWALDSDVRKSAVGETGRANSRVEFGVGRHLSDRTDTLCNTANNDLCEELNHASVSGH